MKNILISTGGSGGHTVPAKIIYEHLKREFNLFMSSDDRGIKFLDIQKYNINIINVPKISKNCFGFSSVESGQKRLPTPPAIIKQYNDEPFILFLLLQLRHVLNMIYLN